MGKETMKIRVPVRQFVSFGPIKSVSFVIHSIDFGQHDIVLPMPIHLSLFYDTFTITISTINSNRSDEINKRKKSNRKKPNARMLLHR